MPNVALFHVFPLGSERECPGAESSFDVSYQRLLKHHLSDGAAEPEPSSVLRRRCMKYAIIIWIINLYRGCQGNAWVWCHHCADLSNQVLVSLHVCQNPPADQMCENLSIAPWWLLQRGGCHAWVTRSIFCPWLNVIIERKLKYQLEK